MEDMIMGQTERVKAKPKFERTYKILEYLKKNTDSENPTTRAKIYKDDKMKEYVRDKGTFNRTIKEMARTLNADEDAGYKPESEWKIVFDDFKKRYGDEIDEAELDAEDLDVDFDEDKNMRMEGLYYQRTFSYDEINDLIDGIWANRTLDSQSAEKLSQKVEEHLTTTFYKRGFKQICKIKEPQLVDRAQLKDNMKTIQRAIDNNVQISFQFNGYTLQKSLAPVRRKRDLVSPYYIVADGGRYYMLACKKVTKYDGTVEQAMSVWRIDLMTDVEIPMDKKKSQMQGIKRIPKRDVKNLPLDWSEDFHLSHMNMAYDKPIIIKLRVSEPDWADNPKKDARAGYTFLHDYFGDTFRHVKKEQTEPFGDIVSVKCSPYAMANWALQFSDRVEVLEPKEVRDEVIKKVQRLNEKYGVQSGD